MLIQQHANAQDRRTIQSCEGRNLSLWLQSTKLRLPLLLKGATALLAGGADSATVKLHGRWRPNTFQRYPNYGGNVGDG
ncbi:LOW QUALITY PROTEIN: hypothetical protein PHMEG_0004781 [Phytophthora megakarya]|uniref:Uncharacterized protein n=1 Tax=Phytophthora megakarya TaxID=4795 RepID=A0A225WT61_9STRA|nr:LOW QUALITY PROTEIN: hypothetical protein PHMEG_0004781 [Phytophthora megakarya]